MGFRQRENIYNIYVSRTYKRSAIRFIGKDDRKRNIEIDRQRDRWEGERACRKTKRKKYILKDTERFA